MEKIILQDILKEAKEKAESFHLYHNHLELSYKRNRRRIQDAPRKKIYIPEEWNGDSKHNPFYVIKRRKQIAKSISKSILTHSYKPNPPYLKNIPKKGGGSRKIRVYQIPDAAVSDRFYHNLLSKNKHRFSSLSYAYRNDRNIHFAIQDIAHELTNVSRIFVAEFDFSDFFGSINHDFLFKQFEENAFLISELDKYIIHAFIDDFEVGIPQGTSISLFLANLVCWKLDRRLENEGIRFARYADDTIIWSKEYAKISKAFDIISEFSKESGIRINKKKSAGINLLQSKELESEFQSTKEYIEFLGYRISYENIGIKDTSIQKIKKQISYLLYRNLIQPIKSEPFKAIKIPSNGLDRDFMTAIMQVRRYLYGNMTENVLRRYVNGTYKRLSFKGIMSFYPLITDESQMKYLDQWLVSTIINVIRKREKLLIQHNPNFNVNQFPFNCDKDSLIIKCKHEEVFGKKGLMQIPSFLRIYKALRLGLTREGIEKIMNPNSFSYYDS
ncbi:reverse transcriptase domain-containing protein [Bacteroides graminisolvens]|nr:reverse transcriptase domain-containing protein [Bacteroides graminisolvens]